MNRAIICVYMSQTLTESNERTRLLYASIYLYIKLEHNQMNGQSYYMRLFIYISNLNRIERMDRAIICVYIFIYIT
jgi:hypothetical protein